eukprot:Nitzschia sp. Nitz4//scaffold208_size52459//21883//26692//NITZ4_006812-RA/size52459-snap-gene-0.6-mRNA-1//-1//CDS//3329541657//9336//frame0
MSSQMTTPVIFRTVARSLAAIQTTMVLHVYPVVAAAVGYWGARNGCVTSPREGEEKKDDSAKENDAKNSSRSMVSWNNHSNNPHRHMDVQLRSAASHATVDDTPFDSATSFLGGDFASGIIRHVPLEDRSWSIAYSCRAQILAVGLENQIQLLETSQYTTLTSIPWNGKASAVQWCSGAALDPAVSFQHWREDPFMHDRATGDILVVTGLDGTIGLWKVEPDLVELKGVQQIYSNCIHAEIRCMACQPIGHGRLILTVGDKRGTVTLILVYTDNDIDRIVGTSPVILDHKGDAILALDIHWDSHRPLLAIGTRQGNVFLYPLELHEVGTSFVACKEPIWSCQRMGAVRSALFSTDGRHLYFGGYDKCAVRVDTALLVIVREMELQGTINTIAMDPLDRFLAVGCRDKSATIYDTSTFAPIKRIQTAGWVTSITWGLPGVWSDVVAIRSANTVVSVLDLTPIHATDMELSSAPGYGSSLSWTPNGRYVARIENGTITICDSHFSFNFVNRIALPDRDLRCIAFSKRSYSDVDEDVECVQLAAVGLGGTLYLLQFTTPDELVLVDSVFVEDSLWVLAWSCDGTQIATGGKGKSIFKFTVNDEGLHREDQIDIPGRVWGVDFKPKGVVVPTSDGIVAYSLAVASGDYSAILYNESSEATLRVVRSRTVRCVGFHPKLPLLAVGDGAGSLAVIDYRREESIIDIDLGDRVNVVHFSPAGDFLVVGTDGGRFTLHDTRNFDVVQELDCQGFALSASFSPSGKYLMLGSSAGPYTIVRLGPLLGIDLAPLGSRSVPSWALTELLFRSGFGPSLIQRHMLLGNQENVQWISHILKEYPDAIFTLNRHREENCLETALRLRKVKILQLAVKTIVDGGLDKGGLGRRSILTTEMPETCRHTIEAMLRLHPATSIADILQSLSFVKVPYTKPRIVHQEKRMQCASSTYLDPWNMQPVAEPPGDYEAKLTRIPAVLPLPGLGSMSFLSSLVARAPPTAFDNEAMGVVLRVMWERHIRTIYIVDTIVFVCYYGLWIAVVESTAVNLAESDEDNRRVNIAMAAALMTVNSLFAVKECVQSDLGRRPGYFYSMWNQVDIVSIILVYSFGICTELSRRKVQGQVPLEVATTLLLTMKLISYLRAFNQTGWLVTVLSRNFWDVRGFLVVLLSILIGFSVSFRLIFANIEPSCELEVEDSELVQVCGDNPYGSLRRSILSTFELTVLGTYETSMLLESEHLVLSIFVFVLAVTCVLVVALNALISLLADSYARVQEDATANKRKEKAELIVEYLALLPKYYRKRIEKNTRYFHALLEADAAGELVMDDDDWHGGLNSVRDELIENSREQTEAHRKAMEAFQSEFTSELKRFREDVMTRLEGLAADVEALKSQAEGGVTISGKRVVGAVKAVKEISRRGKSLFRKEADDDMEER